MIFRAAAVRSGVQRLVAQQSRLASTKSVTASSSSGGSFVPNSFLNRWYNTFGKSTALYVSWVVTLIVVGEYATGKMTDSLWTMNNYGKTFETVDWSKFDQFEEEEGEEGGGDDEDDDDDDE